MTTPSILMGSDGQPNTYNNTDMIYMYYITSKTIVIISKEYSSPRSQVLPLYGSDHIWDIKDGRISYLWLRSTYVQESSGKKIHNLYPVNQYLDNLEDLNGTNIM